MAEQKHTPGPWTARGRYVGTPNHMSFIAECRDQNGNWTDEPMACANARLISAAPTMLEALQQIAALDQHSGASLRDRAASEIARAAISKAGG